MTAKQRRPFNSALGLQKNMGEGYIAIYIIGVLSILMVIVWAVLGQGTRKFRFVWSTVYFMFLSTSVVGFKVVSTKDVWLSDAAFLSLCLVIFAGFGWAPIVRALTNFSSRDR